MHAARNDKNWKNTKFKSFLLDLGQNQKYRYWYVNYRSGFGFTRSWNFITNHSDQLQRETFNFRSVSILFQSFCFLLNVFLRRIFQLLQGQATIYFYNTAVRLTSETMISLHVYFAITRFVISKFPPIQLRIKHHFVLNRYNVTRRCIFF